LKSGVKIFHLIIFMWLLIAALHFGVIVSYFSLTADYIMLLFADAPSAISVTGFKLIDTILASLLFTLSFPLVIIFRKKIKFINAGINFSAAFLILLGFVFLFAPIISDQNPEFSKNLSVTKLLPPLSSVKQINLKTGPDRNEAATRLEAFRTKMEKIIKPSFDDNIIFTDSISTHGNVVYYQKNKAFEIEKEKLFTENGVIVIEEKFFLLGSDEFGRDIFSRLVYGTRISITVGFCAVILSFFIGTILGFIAGYRGGLLDAILNRFAELFLAFPVIYLVILILALFGSSIWSVIIVLGISGWMSLFKIVKTEVLSVKHKDFFFTAGFIGLNKSQLLFKEILPVMLVPVLANLIFLFSNVILAEAALSFIGLGTGNTYPSWGTMISSGHEYVTTAWWLIAFPGAALIFTLFSINFYSRKAGSILNPGLSK